MTSLTPELKASLKSEHFSDAQLAVVDRVLAEDAQRDEHLLTPEQEAALQATGVITPEQIEKVKARLAGGSFSEGGGSGDGVAATPEMLAMCRYLKSTNPRAVDRLLRP